MSEPTPRPWAVTRDEQSYENWRTWLLDSPKGALGRTWERADADLIVRAVNAYDAREHRIAELESALRKSREIHAGQKDFHGCRGNDPCDECYHASTGIAVCDEALWVTA